MMGNFNADFIASKPCKYTRNLMHATRLHGLSQLVQVLTHITEHTKTAIYIIFVTICTVLCNLGYKNLEPETVLLFLLSKKLVFARPMWKFAK